jgi:hypothetical protein
MGKLVRMYTPTQAARFIDMRLSGIERRGFRGKAAQELLNRPDKIAVEFRRKNLVKVVGITKHHERHCLGRLIQESHGGI